MWCDIDPCYVYHVLNAYDEPEGSVIVDLVRYPDMFATEKYGPGSTAQAVLERWTVDPKTKRVGQEVLDDVGQEFPRIDERQVGRVHRYGYTAEVNVRENWAEFGGVRKHDLVSGGVERHDLGAGRGGGEPVFVPGGRRLRRGRGVAAHRRLRQGARLERRGDHRRLGSVGRGCGDGAPPPTCAVRLPRRVDPRSEARLTDRWSH